jgi:predicted metalloprotease with PDZ domain
MSQAGSAKAASAPESIGYRVDTAHLASHLFHITLTIPSPAAEQVLQLPVWIPGSYLVREFSKNLQQLRCTQGGRSVALRQRDKASWCVSCTPDAPLQVQYAVYAFDNSVRTAWLDDQRGFFNGTSLFLRVADKQTQPHLVDIACPESACDWSLATGLEAVRVDRKGFGCYRANNYDALVDCPVEMGNFWSGNFTACGIPHRFVVAGAADNFDGARLLADTQAICEQELRFWHGAGKSPSKAAPFSSYLFMLNAVHDSYGGLEHRNSTALISTRKDLPRLATPSQTSARQAEGYTTLLGLISHEYFHTWNVKQLRPAEFRQYDYTQENYTELLWFFEGFTSYYDDLLLRRAERIDNAQYLKLLGKTINQVQQSPGRKIQSVAQASFDAWVKYYRQDENTANATVSYYTKGALVALCLDLSLRAEDKGSLDQVMRALWQRCAAGPMTERDLLDALQHVSGRSWSKEIERWVHGTQDLPLQALLERHGVQYHQEPDQLAQQLGMRVKESGALKIQQVLRGGAAEQAGFAAGDEWLAVQSATPKASGPWRITTLDEITQYCGRAKKLTAIVARDQRLHTLTLRIPPARRAVRLSVHDPAALAPWLEGKLPTPTPDSL